MVLYIIKIKTIKKYLNKEIFEVWLNYWYKFQIPNFINNINNEIKKKEKKEKQYVLIFVNID